MKAAPLKLALIGDPVEHSASPTLQRGYMEIERVAGTYETIRVPRHDGKNAVVALHGLGYCGLNVTTPLKEESFAACNGRSQTVMALGAVNTIVFDGEDAPFGDNTDVAGALAAFRFATGAEPRDAGALLVLGAGPTARAAVYALAANGGRVFVWSRRREAAEGIAARFEARVWDGQPVEVAFSTLPPGADLSPEIGSAMVAASKVIDANYGARATLAHRLGRSDVADGLAMLSGSARASFDLWLAAHTKAHAATH